VEGLGPTPSPAIKSGPVLIGPSATFGGGRGGALVDEGRVGEEEQRRRNAEVEPGAVVRPSTRQRVGSGRRHAQHTAGDRVGQQRHMKDDYHRDGEHAHAQTTR